jgi:hypothetical protein
LAVWSDRYIGWVLPGGSLLPDESVEDGCARDLYAQTGYLIAWTRRVYDAGHMLAVSPDRARYVHVLRVGINQGAAVAIGHRPIHGWFTREEFLRGCPFAAFYRKAFAAIPIETGGAKLSADAPTP